MNTGDEILLPVTVEKFPAEKEVEHLYSEEQREFLHSIELYKVWELLWIFRSYKTISYSYHISGSYNSCCQ